MIAGSTAVPSVSSALRTASLATNFSGSWERLARSTWTPRPVSHSKSAANRDRVGSTSVPHTPVEQHIAGSNTLTVAITHSLDRYLRRTRRHHYIGER